MDKRNAQSTQTARQDNPKAKVDKKTELLLQAIADQKAFLNDVDRKGPVMEATIDHRSRVEKFLDEVKKWETNLEGATHGS